jgi:hypothetical protein
MSNKSKQWENGRNTRGRKHHSTLETNVFADDLTSRENEHEYKGRQASKQASKQRKEIATATKGYK